MLNGTGRQGLARVGTRLLRREGLDVVYFGNADQPTESTRVLLRRGERSAAERVVSILGAGQVLWQPDTLLRLDVTVILGEDFRPPPEVHP
ncbi:MAG: LytR C-terminal domain-containing protein [Gemmatimonadales bacterium]